MYAYPILPLQFSYWINYLNINFRAWRLLVLVLALPCLVAACLLQFFQDSPKFLASKGRYEEALEVLRTIYSVNTGNSRDSFPVSFPLIFLATFLFPKVSLVRHGISLKNIGIYYICEIFFIFVGTKTPSGCR